ncbi:ABC transporter ATP-binding protein [Streptomyces verrucosisporus]|uniref:ABC transporter ATP-binding protein n=1 Tax=Streptomyces verrucosisporus TaxID=1695161 RepID=UPI0019D1BB0A|nr:ATP-binding cassette domain-containing protein [Streptomyces verrucosisporus]MBN3931209.1 ABC transporter ATP-binding protein [Streptomyces verrucosisporus]
MSRPVARVDDLRVEVDGRALVDGVSFTVLPGRCTALVGPSGSGKSTTGLALLGEYPAGARVSGTVDVAGPAGYVPQNPAAALNPARRAGALLADIARAGGGGRAERAGRVRAALRAAQLPDPEQVLRKHPHQLSGGQQQRVVIAQALLSGAPVLVADEPTTGQDALTKRRVVDELRAVLARGVAVVLLSHDLDVVRELAGHVVVLRDGRTSESGPTARILSAPGHPRAADMPAAAVPVRTDGPPEPDGRGAAPALRVEGVTAWHGRRRTGPVVLHDLSLTLGAGRCLAVVGRSGSGKTTLARCLAGLHRRWSGRALLAGEPLPRSVRDRSREHLAAVQYVFQDARASFDEYRPVLEQVARTAVRLRGADPDEARTEALSALTGVGIGADTASRPPGALSGGELQRAALVRALLARPRVLLCDEITSGLDPVARKDVCALLAGLTTGSGNAFSPREGTSLVVVTHDLSVAAGLADDIAVVDEGRVVESGAAGQMLSAPRHPFTRRLLEAMPSLAGAVRGPSA